MSDVTTLEIPVKNNKPVKIEIPFSKYAHIPVIYIIAKGMKDAGFLENYLELGVSKGSCFNVVAPLAKRAFAVDVNKELRRNIEHNKNLFWFRGNSTKFLQTTQFKFDMIFIDARHTFKNGMRDFEAAIRTMNPNCLILMHDTYPPTPEFVSDSYCGNVHRAATYIRKNMINRFEVLTLPFYYGLTIIRNSLGKQCLFKRETT